MHDTAMAAGAAFFSTYFPDAPPRVLDIGSLDVNGSMRDVAPPGADYVGVDLEAGRGVDVVLQPGEALPFPPDSFDACVSVACFEHDTAFWDTFLQMVRVVRPGGYIYILVPSNGPYHAYPADNWRFYADAGLALTAWIGRQGQQIELIESGTLRRRADVWNDFVGVFQKHPVDPAPRARFMLDAFPDAMNIRRWGSTEMVSPEPMTEDVALLGQARAEAQGWAEAAENWKGEAHRLLAAQEAQRAEYEGKLEEARARHESEINHARAEAKSWAETAENWRAEAQRLLAVHEAQRSQHEGELDHARAEAKGWAETAENWRAEAHRLLTVHEAQRNVHETELAALAAEAQRLAAELEAQRDILSAEIEDLRHQLLARGEEIKALDARVQALLSSTSWRITKPLRSAAHLLRPSAH